MNMKEVKRESETCGTTKTCSLLFLLASLASWARQRFYEKTIDDKSIISGKFKNLLMFHIVICELEHSRLWHPLVPVLVPSFVVDEIPGKVLGDS